MNIVQSMRDPALFRPWFRDPATWAAWRAFLAALFALPMSAADLATYVACTGRTTAPDRAFTEAWLIVGRRGGKSLALALIAVYLACFRDWTGNLAPGERGTILVLATDKKQARTIMRYVRGMIEQVPLLAARIEKLQADEIELAGRVTIEVVSASYRSVRGYTLIAALVDEIAFLRQDESANPDTEILDAIRPAMATMPGAMLLCASSPYARRGALWDAWKRHHGRDGAPALVWQAATRTMNPAVPQRVVDEAMERDPASAAAEYGGQFRNDLAAFVAREVVESCVCPGRHELPPMPKTAYVAFVDPSGGSADSMTLAVAHQHDGVAVLDAVREIRPPFSPESVVIEFAALLKAYGLRTVTGDRYAGEWPRERFLVRGIAYELSDRAKSDIFRDILPALNSGKVELLDSPRLAAQFCGLERRTARGGRDSIDHAPGAHDDMANAAAGALLMAAVPAVRNTVRVIRLPY